MEGKGRTLQGWRDEAGFSYKGGIEKEKGIEEETERESER